MTPSAAHSCSRRARCSASSDSVYGSRATRRPFSLFGRLPRQPGLCLRDAGRHPQDCSGDVDVGPAQRADLAAAGARQHGQPEEQTPLGIGPRLVEQRRGFLRARWVRLGRGRRGHLGQFGAVDAKLLPAHGAAERRADDVVNLPDGAAAQRPTDVPGRTAAVAQVPALLKPGVEAVEDTRVELVRRPVADGREDMQPDQVLVPLPGRVGQVGDLQPLRQRLPDGDVRARVTVLVDLALQSGQRHLRGVVRPVRLAEIPRLARQWVGAGVHDGAEAARGERLDVAAGAATARGHHPTLRALIPQSIPRRGSQHSGGDVTAGQRGCPQRDSNPCYRLERAASWATRRWGLAGVEATGPRAGDRSAGTLRAETRPPRSNPGRCASLTGSSARTARPAGTSAPSAGRRPAGRPTDHYSATWGVSSTGRAADF